MKRKLISALLALALAVSLVPAFGVTARAAEMCTVTFHNNGHGTLKTESVQIEKGKSLNGSGTLAFRDTLMGKADGLQHIGWGKTPDATNAGPNRYNMNSNVEGDLDLYAIWMPYLDHVTLSLPESSKPVAGAPIPAEPEVTLVYPENPGGSDPYYEIYYTDAEWIKDTVWLDDEGNPVTEGTFKNNEKYTLRVNVFSWLTYKDGPLPFTVDTRLETDMDKKNATLDGRQTKKIEGDGDSHVILYFDFQVGEPVTKYQWEAAGAVKDKGLAEEGETVTVTAVDDGYDHGCFFQFDHWTVAEGGVTLKNPNSRTTTFTMPANDVVVEAVFNEYAEQETDTVVMDLAAPAAGEKPADTLSCTGAELSSLTWYRKVPMERGIEDWEEMPASVTFREGKSYLARIVLKPGAGYQFAPQSELNVTCNGSDLGGDIASWSKHELVIHKEFKAAAAAQTNPFVDVKEGAPYYDAVLWAYYAEPQVTNGMDATHFGPDLTVTRGQCVAFLWRAMGEPEPSSTANPFVDVPASQYYYKPVLWAVEKGITKGVDDTHFAPDDTLSTQHIVTFLYRTLNPGKDGWDGPAAAWAGAFDTTGHYYPFGVNIPVNNETPCPRANVVQFLYAAVK